MNTYKVPDALEDAYKGAVLALIATKGGTMLPFATLPTLHPTQTKR